MAVVTRVLPELRATEPAPVIDVPDGARAAEAISALLDDATGLTRLGEAGRDWAIAQRSIPSVTQMLLERYRSFGFAA